MERQCRHQDRHKDPRNPWTQCVMCRSHKQSLSVLQKAQQRVVHWPESNQHVASPIEDPAVYTSIDDAFSSILQFMSTTSRQCKRFYRSNKESNKSNPDHYHCNRFHTPHYTKVQRSNPLQTAEDVHMVVNPGTYSVTAGEWGKTFQQTHVVHVQAGQSVDLDFCM